MAVVHVDKVVKSFGPVDVLKGVDVTIADGEMLVILGASGCGKTTLLRLIAGLETLSSGTIRIGERVVNDVEPKDRDIAMVFQNYALYPHMKVYDNMAYGLRNRGMAKAEIDRRVKAAAQLLGLGQLLERKPRQLSGGQRQRVAMGRAIVREPAVFLFDEPLSNLDAALRAQMRVEIRQLQKRLATTGIFVTHDQVEAMTMADRIMLMNEGQVEQIGPPMDLYAHPESRYVATFIGSPRMNLLDGQLDTDGLTFQGQGLTLRLPQPRPAWAGRPLTLGIRPEHVHPAQGEGEVTFRLPVRVVERLGADQIVFGDLEGGGTFLVRLPGHLTIDEGHVLQLAADPQSLHPFDAQNGRRLDDWRPRLAA
ncbi:MAG: sn-glycerol-3-phosphate ABC transporter ATP-binding protein UgpC [Geminicoccaceae bacterium]|nr:MAG: sn-glycerol-3-phosphate ABC transporter ATP-binding protein UgpC [Geminicoccaceae bacterium]